MERFLLDHKVFPSMAGALKRAKINRIEKLSLKEKKQTIAILTSSNKVNKKEMIY